ncbi:hypothetical protein LCGC14_1009480, partial [marine sediment metagenome]
MTEREEKVWLKLINTTHKITKLMTPLIIKSMTPPTINWVS